MDEGEGGVKKGKISEKTKENKTSAKYFDQGDEVLLEVEGQTTEFGGDGDEPPPETSSQDRENNEEDSDSDKSEEMEEGELVQSKGQMDGDNRNWNRSLDKVDNGRRQQFGHGSRDEVIVLPRDIEKERKEEEEGMQ